MKLSTWTRIKIIANTIKQELISYPTAENITFAWGFGSLAGLTLAIQIITGIFLTMHYTADAEKAFDSVENIMRNVNYGWLMRYLHSNGASMFFIVVYLHIGRGIYYASYLKKGVWYSGIALFLLMMATAFIGYVLPWGQMSFWGATVITNLISIIPYIGSKIVFWVWGGYSIANPTLNRLLSIHYVLPFVILAFVILHLILLHLEGSSNPASIDEATPVPFYPYMVLKDIYLFWIYAFVYSYLVFFAPNYLGHPDNYIKANPLVTPPHIVPEWYFLPFYAILRAVPNKPLGVIAMISAILILAILPFYKAKIESGQFRPRYKLYFWCFVFNFLLLGWLGAQPIEYPYDIISKYSSLFYFFYLTILIPYSQLFDSGNEFKGPFSKKIYNLVAFLLKKFKK